MDCNVPTRIAYPIILALRRHILRAGWRDEDGKYPEKCAGVDLWQFAGPLRDYALALAANHDNGHALLMQHVGFDEWYCPIDSLDHFARRVVKISLRFPLCQIRVWGWDLAGNVMVRVTGTKYRPAPFRE